MTDRNTAGRPAGINQASRSGLGRTGRIAVCALAMGCAVLLSAGCGSCAAPSAATPAPPRASAQPSRTAGTPTAVQRRALAARYLAIARPASRNLDHDLDGLADHDRDDLATVDADLRDAAATERLFDHRLIAIAFPPQTETFVRLLCEVNQARAALTAAAAASMSLRQLHGYQPRLDAANGPVEEAVQVIRSQLGLPPPDTS